MTENQKSRVKDIKKLFALKCLKETVSCIVWLLFSGSVGHFLFVNDLLDKETYFFYLAVSAWIFALGYYYGVLELYDIMKKDAKTVLTTEDSEKDN